jgi:hypothetical protein
MPEDMSDAVHMLNIDGLHQSRGVDAVIPDPIDHVFPRLAAASAGSGR